MTFGNALSFCSRIFCLCTSFVSSVVFASGALNADVTQKNLQETICVPGYTKSVRPSTNYTDGVKRLLMKRQGIDLTLKSDYELDHLIPLALGGHPRKLENLALQLWEGPSGAKKKDRLEVKLQCLVCNGQSSLSDAQTAIANDWELAYHRYAHLKCNRQRSNREAQLSN